MSVHIKLNEVAAQTNNFAVGRDVVRLRGSIATFEGPARCTLVSVRAIADSKNQRVVVLVYELARRAVFGKTCARQIRDAAEFDYSIPRGACNSRGTVALRLTDRIVACKFEISHVQDIARVDNAHGTTELSGVRSRRSISLARNRHAVEHNGDRLRIGVRAIANIANNTARIGQLARKFKLN